MNRFFTLLITCLFLVGCTSSSIAPAPTNTSGPTALPTNTPTPTPEPTPTPTPIDGLLFFDMNGSGLRDEASFQYDSARLSDERQPLQADLLAAINAYLVEHPDIIDGDLVTLAEPGLSDYTVCAGSNCVTTDAEGRFQLLMAEVSRSVNISIQDPNSGTPALEMRYINKWKRPVTVAEYTRDVDAATMVQLTAVPDCATDAEALVCKQATGTLLVREQHLNDTTIYQLAEGAELLPDKPNELGLMQGFLTLPYQQNLEKRPILMTYTDLDLGIGNRLDWKNNSTTILIGNQNLWNDVSFGVYDQHQGTDWAMPIGTPILATGGGRVIISAGGYPDNFARYVRQTIDIPNDKEVYLITYAHNNINLTKVGDSLFRGQIVALSGNDAGIITTNPHLHLSIWNVPREIWNQYHSLPTLYDFLFGRGIFEGNGRLVYYTNGSKVALDYCPFLNQLFILGSDSTYSE